jgi:hypothetical protein
VAQKRSLPAQQVKGTEHKPEFFSRLSATVTVPSHHKLLLGTNTNNQEIFN